MTENSQTDIRQQTAGDAAGEAIEALLTVYWADSFEVDLLQNRLAQVIAACTATARWIREPVLNSEASDGEKKPATSLQNASVLGLESSIQSV